LLIACATTTSGREHATVPVPDAADARSRPAPAETPSARPATGSPAAAQPGAARPAPRPLEPLRAFTPEEWKRIRRVQRFVRNSARHHGLSASLINGMIWVETKFRARARGRRGPRGLLQIMPRTARAMARRLRRKYMPYSADFSIAAGTEYLMLMFERFDRDLQLALAAYNAGPAVVHRWRAAGSAPPKPRRPYVSRVEQAARAFCERLPQPRFEPEASPFRCPD
jgi:soluble lytic murein transglycosylase-like protein